MFFFQAEDGIRDLVRSRGLGDVYKRQIMSFFAPRKKTKKQKMSFFAPRKNKKQNMSFFAPVSYTHLTLPTSDLV